MTAKVNFDDFIKEVLATPGGQTAYDIFDAYQDKDSQFLYNLTTGDFRTPCGFPYEHMEYKEEYKANGMKCSGVFRFNFRYYRCWWAYSRFGGYVVDGITDTLCEVSPVQKTITFYE